MRTRHHRAGQKQATGKLIRFPPKVDKNTKQLGFPFIEKKNLLDHALLSAAKTGNVRKILEFLRRGADIDTMDPYGRTPLMHAAKKGFRRACETMISSGADINVRDNYGMTAIHHAIDDGHTITAAFLRKQGARW